MQVAPLTFTRLEPPDPTSPELQALESGDQVDLEGLQRLPQGPAAVAAATSGHRRRLTARQAHSRELREALGKPDTGGFSTGDGGGSGQERRRWLEAIDPDLTAGPDEGPDSDYVKVSYLRRRYTSYYVAGVEYWINDDPRRVQSVTFILNVCGQANPLSRQDLEPYWSDTRALHSPSLPQFFNTCSHDILPFRPDENPIVGPIDVPCEGTPSSGRPFHPDRCTDRELLGWAAWAEDYVRREHPEVPLTREFPLRRVFVLPDLPACRSWASLASVGCSTRFPCPVFIKATPSLTPGALAAQLMHDLAHTYSMDHAGAAAGAASPDALGGPRADASCPMGAAGEVAGLVCPNAANSYKTGWNQFLARPRGGIYNLSGGFEELIELPATSAKLSSLVVINLTPAMTSPVPYLRSPVYILSYRLPEGYTEGNKSPHDDALPPGWFAPPDQPHPPASPPSPPPAPWLYDSGLDPELIGRVYVHRYDGDLSYEGTPARPELVASAREPGLLTFPDSEPLGKYVRIRLMSRNTAKGTVQVRVCTSRSGEKALEETDENTCYDNFDNDCNGRKDCEEDSCMEAGVC
ncbi:hypothetical protein HYH03_013717 [Edaphochlamys debaryana]|uniref:Peptidase M11 gametolysin domain-containing protein n=1 Tax=Edaphochlamys debaryana TaxID=47281 RepID=A0A835XRP2_9CHLO|nr:hypothetical protein HYH03_013717 [Edaphochlamys debaryana]|eukprot:KAG2487718.1 hypothetical protein HYH03_013717 [Edaphochlamys debaryana]